MAKVNPHNQETPPPTYEAATAAWNYDTQTNNTSRGLPEHYAYSPSNGPGWSPTYLNQHPGFAAPSAPQLTPDDNYTNSTVPLNTSPAAPYNNESQSRTSPEFVQHNSSEESGRAPQNATLDDNGSWASEFKDNSIRTPFVRMVHGILMCQMLVSLASTTLFLNWEPAYVWARETSYLWLLALVATAGCAAMLPFDKIRRESPTNVIYLIILTLVGSFLLGVISSVCCTKGVMMALGITASTYLLMTLFATEIVFSFCLCILLVPGISVMYWYFWLEQSENEILPLVCASLGAFIFCSFFIYYTSDLLFENQYLVKPDQFVFAVLNLYWKFLQILAFILILAAVNFVLSFCCIKVTPKISTV